MEDIEKLSCTEEIIDSDLDNSGNEEVKDSDDKSKKRKRQRRRREIDMIKLSDDEDDSEDETMRKKMTLMTPSREPRTCVLKASQKRRPLSRLLEQLLRNLEKRDPHQFFAWPVNDNFAPNYSKIIKKPMDFSTIKQKIDDNDYKSLNCFISDFKLMCNNAMKYNKPGTVYHKAAKRLLHAGLKQLTPHKLRPLGNILTYMYEIPIRELGFDIGKMDVHRVMKRSSPMKSGGSEAESEGRDSRDHQDSSDQVNLHMERVRELHRRKLAKKAFPRMDSEGKTTLCLVTNTVDGTGEDKPITIGQYIGKLQQGTGSLHSLREDRRNLVKGVKPLHYGPYSSHAPSHDTTFATLSKEESRLIYHTLPYETGHGNEEMLRFAPDSPWSAIYDMEAMFPDRKKVPEETPEPEPTPNISSLKVDIEELKSLSSLGIDMDWLTDIEDEILESQRDFGISAALATTNEMLKTLEAEQHARLSAPPPPHLGACRGAGATERDSARRVAACLKSVLARVAPRHVVATPAVRAALGVTLRHLDTPVPVDDFVDLDMEPRDVSDQESRSSHDK